MVKVATWNVNSIKARLANVLDWLESAGPDIALLQELKCEEDKFPFFEINSLGYEAVVVGQKSWNGVAILSRGKIEDRLRGLPGDESDSHARYVEATTLGLRVAAIYLPNGNPVGGDKFTFKLSWMERLRAHARSLLEAERPTVLGGDYNVIPKDEDVYDPAAFAGDALAMPETRRSYRALLYLGYTDAFRALHNEPHSYTYWDYKGRAWAGDQGLRIDHLLLSPQAADRLESCEIDRSPRGKEKASDHTPIWCGLRQ